MADVQFHTPQEVTHSFWSWPGECGPAFWFLACELRKDGDEFCEDGEFLLGVEGWDELVSVAVEAAGVG